MSKNKNNEAAYYELLYLVPNQFSEEELTPINDKVKKIITEAGGEMAGQESLGKKRLAYRIKQFRHGYYELRNFTALSSALPKINQQLKLFSNILRYQILKTHPKTAEQLAKETRVINELNKTPEETEKKDSAPRPTAPKVEPKEIKSDTDDNKMELKDLDDKLNQILDTDNLL